MRPIRLEVQGLTSYRESIALDFSELDLFAITGPTGAGKSSLVDAITYALYGQAPRVGRNVKELISQGAERLKVSLHFSAGDAQYRIHRESGRKSTKPPQLERFDTAENEWRPEEVDRVKDTNRYIEDLLRMDYDAFVRSVLLPQGEFQEFLAGDRDQRRKVLDGLLQLGVYAQMQQRANSYAISHTEDADRIRQRLETELRDATPETLTAAQADLDRYKTQADSEAAARDAMESAHRLGETLGEARGRERDTRERLHAAEEMLEKAKRLLDSGEETLAALDARIKTIQEGMADAAYDPDMHLRLTQCLPLLREMDLAARRERQLAEDIGKAAAQVAAQVDEAKRISDVMREAASAAEQAQATYDRAREGNAAALLQSRLNPGEDCPVCGQVVKELKSHSMPAELPKLRSLVDDAKAAERRADGAVREIETALTKSQQSLEGYESQLTEAQADHARRSDEIGRLLPEPNLNTADVESRIATLEVARERMETLGRDEKALIDERETESAAMSGARNTVNERQAEVKSLTRELESATKQATEAERAVKAIALDKRWDDVLATVDHPDELQTLLRQRLHLAQQHENEARQQIGACQTRIELIETNIERARELASEEKTHRETATLAKDLATLLKADRFPTFIRERALQRLARDGSRRLEEISSGRYVFAVEGQDFLIVDQWNGGESRSVRTLSGGETFLASLALALALAEHLPSLSSGAPGGALESLFIDEGFSNLDVETLDVVASALEVLGQDRRRLIGVVTHLPALAERMPARIVVHKSQTGSTVSIE